MDIVDELFVTLFNSLNKTCLKELEAINKQYPFENLKVITRILTLRQVIIMETCSYLKLIIHVVHLSVMQNYLLQFSYICLILIVYAVPSEDVTFNVCRGDSNAPGKKINVIFVWF